MLDLPQHPDQLQDSRSDGNSALDRKGSLTRRVTSNTQAPFPTLSSNAFPSVLPPPANDSLSLPSLGFSVPSASAGSTYTSPATSYGSTLRQAGHTSPTQSKTNNSSNYGAGRTGLGIDEYGIRLRQGTNASSTANSDYSSTALIAFGSLNINDNNNTNFNNGNTTRGIGGFNNDSANYNGNDQNGFGGGFNPRRDSGYAPSMYNSSASLGFPNFADDDRRGSRSAVSHHPQSNKTS